MSGVFCPSLSFMISMRVIPTRKAVRILLLLMHMSKMRVAILEDNSRHLAHAGIGEVMPLTPMLMADPVIPVIRSSMSRMR
mgnify:FL=1